MRLQRALWISWFAGIPCLAIQTLFTKAFSVGLGQDYISILATSMAFLGGMAIACVSSARLSHHPCACRRWFIICEMLAGAWSLLLIFNLPTFQDNIARWIGVSPHPFRQWVSAFLLPLLLLLPISFAQGTSVLWLLSTLKDLDRTYPKAPLSKLYAANTLGTVTGVLITVFFLLPQLGVQGSIVALVTATLISVTLMALTRVSDPIQDPLVSNPKISVAANWASNSPPQSRPRFTFLAMLMAGFLGLTMHFLGIRALSQVLENTVFTFATVLIVYLIFHALGAKSTVAEEIDSKFSTLPGNSHSTSITSRFNPLVFANLATICVFGKLDPIYRWLRSWMGDLPWQVFLTECCLTLICLAAPAFFMGRLFCTLWCQTQYSHGRNATLYAWNLLGSALSAPFTGLVLIPFLGIKFSAISTSLAYLCIPQVRPKTKIAGGCLFLILGLGVVLPYPEETAGEITLRRLEGSSVEVAVMESPNKHRTLRVNRRFQMGGTGALNPQQRQAHIPLLLHPNPQAVLFLGLGTGITHASAAFHPGLNADGVELLSEINQVRPLFEPHNSWVSTNTSRVFTCDARRFVLAADQAYDVIVGDLFHPALDGVGSLYSLEHFRSIQTKLKPGGLYCQWLPLHQMDVRSFQTVVRTFLKVFPTAYPVLLRLAVDVPILGLVGGGSQDVEVAMLVKRMKNASLESRLQSVSLHDPLRLLACVLSNEALLHSASIEDTVITQDNLWMTLNGPRFSYLQNAKPQDTFAAILPSLLQSFPLKVHHVESSFQSKFDNYIAARNVYLKALMTESEGRINEALDGFVESTRLSADFNLGYAQCITLAPILSKSHPKLITEVLTKLETLRPGQPLARQLLDRL